MYRMRDIGLAGVPFLVALAICFTELVPKARGSATQAAPASASVSSGLVTGTNTTGNGASAATSPLGELQWRDDYAKALEQARSSGRPLILDFTAPWCGWCHKMDDTTMRDAVVQSDLSDYVRVKVDYDRNQPLAQKFHIRGIPAYVILNQFGEFVALSTGYNQVNPFHDWVTTYRQQAFAQESNAAQIDRAVSALGDQMFDPDQITRGRVTERMLTIYMDQANEEGRKVAYEQFKRLVSETPVYAVQYLDDDRLAARILFGNLFAEKYGEAFQYDPWDSPDARKRVAEVWARKVGAVGGP